MLSFFCFSLHLKRHIHKNEYKNNFHFLTYKSFIKVSFLLICHFGQGSQTRTKLASSIRLTMNQSQSRFFTCENRSFKYFERTPWIGVWPKKPFEMWADSTRSKSCIYLLKIEKRELWGVEHGFKNLTGRSDRLNREPTIHLIWLWQITEKELKTGNNREPAGSTVKTRNWYGWSGYWNVWW